METNRRGWVKNAIIIFLVIMLILTFFSNTIMNYSLPEVAAQYAQSGSITSKIRTTATVQANSTHKIVIDETRKILSVAVKEGDDVKIGDVLFYLEDAESNELKSARETLASLEKQYKLKQLEVGVDYYNDELNIKNKRDELKKVQKAIGDFSGNLSDSDAVASEIDRLEAEQKALEKTIKAYETQISNLNGNTADPSIDGDKTTDRINEAANKLATAKAAYEQALARKEACEAALKAAENEYNSANEAYNNISTGGATSQKELEQKIADLEKTIKRYKEDYEIAIKKIDDEIQEAYDAWVDADFRYNSALALYNQGSGSYDAVERWRAESETRQAAYEKLVSDYKPTKESKKLQYDRDMEDYNEQMAELQDQLKSVSGVEAAKNRLDKATKAKSSAETANENAAKAFTEAETAYKEADTDYNKLIRLDKKEGYEAELDALNSENDAIKEKIDALGKVNSLTQELETLVHEFNKKKESDAISNAKDKLDMDELSENIEKQRALVEKYEANSVDAKIVADIDGQVNNLSATTGSETSMGQTLCEIVVTDLGYICEINLNAEQSKRVRTGDDVTISNNWWSNIKGTIASVRNDPKNPGQNKIATITLEGDVTVGQSLSLTIGEKGQTYDSVVPNSAVREDNNGKFVLSVEAKSSPLGNRYIARRVDVTVIASDDTNSAVSGVAGGEFIITTSTKPISAGMQVRMAENSK